MPLYLGGGGGGGAIPSKRLMGMCPCWMGLHFHNRIGYNRAPFFRHFQSRVTGMGHTFLGFWE